MTALSESVWLCLYYATRVQLHSCSPQSADTGQRPSNSMAIGRKALLMCIGKEDKETNHNQTIHSVYDRISVFDIF